MGSFSPEADNFEDLPTIYRDHRSGISHGVPKGWIAGVRIVTIWIARA